MAAAGARMYAEGALKIRVDVALRDMPIGRVSERCPHAAVVGDAAIPWSRDVIMLAIRRLYAEAPRVQLPPP